MQVTPVGGVKGLTAPVFRMLLSLFKAQPALAAVVFAAVAAVVAAVAAVVAAFAAVTACPAVAFAGGGWLDVCRACERWCSSPLC